MPFLLLIICVTAVCALLIVVVAIGTVVRRARTEAADRRARDVRARMAGVLVDWLDASDDDPDHATPDPALLEPLPPRERALRLELLRSHAALLQGDARDRVARLAHDNGDVAYAVQQISDPTFVGPPRRRAMSMLAQLAPTGEPSAASAALSVVARVSDRTCASSAVAALGRIGDPSTALAVAEGLQHAVRPIDGFAALRALGSGSRAGAVVVIETALPLTADNDPAVRALACRLVGDLVVGVGSAPHDDALLRLGHHARYDDDADVRVAALDALARAGDEFCMSVLVECLTADRPDVVAAACTTIAELELDELSELVQLALEIESCSLRDIDAVRRIAAATVRLEPGAAAGNAFADEARDWSGGMAA